MRLKYVEQFQATADGKQQTTQETNTISPVTVKRLALIGAGQMGANHARTAFNSEDFELTYVVDADLNRARRIAEQYGAHSAKDIDGLGKVDCVVVATSTRSHVPLVQHFLQSGIPVLCEKPLTMEIEETETLIQLANAKSIPLQCGFVERFNPAFATAKKILSSEIVHIQATRHSPPATRIASGVAEDLMIHDLDLALSLALHEIQTISGRSFFSAVTGENEISECLMTLENGTLVSLSASRMSQRKIREWRISTNENLLEVDLLRQTIAIYENINQEVGSGGGASYRARTVVDYPFIERAGEPLAMQLSHFSALIDGTIDQTLEASSILKSHRALHQFKLNSEHK